MSERSRLIKVGIFASAKVSRACARTVELFKAGRARFPRFVIHRMRAGALTVGGLGLLLLGPRFLDFVAYAGEYTPQPDVLRDYIVGVLCAGAVGLFILAMPLQRVNRKDLMAVWAAKVAVTLGFMLLYERNYRTDLDAYGYFVTARLDLVPLDQLGFGDGTANTSAVTWLFYQVVGDSYHGIKVLFSAIGLLGVYCFYEASVAFLRRRDRRLLFGLALFPSVLFWSSILGKDPLTFLGIGLFAFGVVSWHRQHKWTSLLCLAVGVMIASAIRPWLVFFLILPLAALIRRPSPTKTSIRAIAVPLAIVVGIAASAVSFLQLFQIFDLSDLVVRIDKISRAWAFGGSGQEPPRFQSFWDLLLFIPLGVFTALYQPLPGVVLNPLLFGLLAGIENLFLLFLTGRAVWRYRRGDLRDPVIRWLLVFVVVWAVGYGFVSYQNLGTALRFKLQILPAFLGLLLCIGRPRLGSKSDSSGLPNAERDGSDSSLEKAGVDDRGHSPQPAGPDANPLPAAPGR